jgi:hypothetical protein
MAGITGQSTITNLLNYHGALYSLTPEDTPFLSSIGGLTGGKSTDATIFGWQTYDLRDASQPARVEGAAAPTAEARTRAFVFNVVQIHHETIETTYTRMAATGEYATTGSGHAGSVGLGGARNATAPEHDWQIVQMLKQIARDVEYSFIRGTFVQPADSASARKTRGILEAITTNAVDKGTAATNATAAFATDIFTDAAHGMATGDQIIIDSVTPATSGVVAGECYHVEDIDGGTFYLTTDPAGGAANRVDIITANITDFDYTVLVEPTQLMVLDLMQDVWDSGGIMEGETRTLICNSALKRYMTKLFITDMGFNQMERTVGGVRVDSFISDFGNVNLMLNRFMPLETLLVASLEQCAPVHLNIPGKGFLFIEPIGKLGSAEEDQLYGEVGLEYGVEKAHGKLEGLHGRYNPA